MRDALIGVAVGELASLVSHGDTRTGIQRLSTKLLGAHGENAFAKHFDAEGRLR